MFGLVTYARLMGVQELPLFGNEANGVCIAIVATKGRASGRRRVMPKLYEYFGLIIMFYANEHEPVHVHGK